MALQICPPPRVSRPPSKSSDRLGRNAARATPTSKLADCSRASTADIRALAQQADWQPGSRLRHLQVVQPARLQMKARRLLTHQHGQLIQGQIPLLAQGRHRGLEGLHGVALLGDFQVRHRALAGLHLYQRQYPPRIVGNGLGQAQTLFEGQHLEVTVGNAGTQAHAQGLGIEQRGTGQGIGRVGRSPLLAPKVDLIRGLGKHAAFCRGAVVVLTLETAAQVQRRILPRTRHLRRSTGLIDAAGGSLEGVVAGQATGDQLVQFSTVELTPPLPATGCGVSVRALPLRGQGQLR